MLIGLAISRNATCVPSPTNDNLRHKGLNFTGKPCVLARFFLFFPNDDLFKNVVSYFLHY